MKQVLEKVLVLETQVLVLVLETQVLVNIPGCTLAGAGLFILLKRHRMTILSKFKVHLFDRDECDGRACQLYNENLFF